jgi:hypothetical protein
MALPSEEEGREEGCQEDRDKGFEEDGQEGRLGSKPNVTGDKLGFVRFPLESGLCDIPLRSELSVYSSALSHFA